MFRRFLRGAVIGVVCLVGACNLLPGSAQQDISKFLTGLSNKTTADLQQALTVALTPTSAGQPVDPAGVQCVTALLTVKGTLDKILANANVPGAGAITAAEFATIIQPGSPTANAARDAIVQGCALKVAQVNGAIAGTAGWFVALAGMFAIPGA